MTNNMAYLGTYSVMGPRQKAFLVLKSRFTKNLVTFKTFFFFFCFSFLLSRFSYLEYRTVPFQSVRVSSSMWPHQNDLVLC